MHLQWNPNSSVSALHVAEACWKYPGRVTDPEVTQIMGPLALQIGTWISVTFPSHANAFWDTLISTGSVIDSDRDLASASLNAHPSTQIDPSHAPRLSGWIAEIKAAFAALFPRYASECPLRLRPLHEQWLGYGRGLMGQWKRRSGIATLIDAVQVIGVQPVLGGYGKPYPDRKRIRIEAVLTNASPDLPEVVRLAWLIAQLHGDAPELRAAFPSKIPDYLLPLAMIPSVLAAGEEIDLTRCDPARVALALEHWKPPLPDLDRAQGELASDLFQWWQDAMPMEGAWETAVGILAKKLAVLSA